MASVAAVLAAFPFAAAPAQEPAAPKFHVLGSFTSRQWVVSAAARSYSLLQDGELDLRLVERDGKPHLHLLQPGQMLGAGSYLRSGSFKIPGDLIDSLAPSAIASLRMAFNDLGEPHELHVDLRIETGDFTVVRTIRGADGGGGALAVLTCRDVQMRPGVPLEATFEVEVKTLAPGEFQLPRDGDDLCDQRRGDGRGHVRLFATDRFGNELAGSFDPLRLDRDHLEWCGELPRDLLFTNRQNFTIPYGADARLRPLNDEELRFPRVGLPLRRFQALASDTRFALHASGLGFDRLLRVQTTMFFGRRGLAEFDWSDVKADAVEPKAAERCDVAVLDAQGEPVRGAWVYARTKNPSDWPPPALFAAESDGDGKARVSVRLADDPRAVEVVAFEAGKRASFGTRPGARVAEGGGGECAVVLDHAASCRIAIAPPPGFRTWAGFLVDDVATLVPIGADGSLALPALGRAATLRLGRPWVEQTVPLTLTAATDAAVAPVAVAAKLARGLARSVRAMDERSGRPVDELELDEVSPAGALVVANDRIVVRAELAGQVVKAKVEAPGFEPVELEFAADAPRDRDLPMKAKAGEPPK
jgi:hypothetical protein